MDFAGIVNENEFFPSGTLSDVLKEEIADSVSRWRDLDNSVHPVERLGHVAVSMVKIFRQIQNESERERKIELIRDARYSIITSLGYTPESRAEQLEIGDVSAIPIAGRATDVSGRDVLWIIETSIDHLEDEAVDPLSGCPDHDQHQIDVEADGSNENTIEKLLSDGVFELPNGPTYVLVIGLSQIVLIDKRKWSARSLLRFDMREIFSRRDLNTIKILACLISREARAPDQGVPISDRIEEEAQRNANAVTASLKKTVRSAIETLGQEIMDVADGKYPAKLGREKTSIDAFELSQECLRYMYRIIFLLYIEANPKLKLLDIKNRVYRKGYSIESLRDLELTPLRTTEDIQGTYLWESLQCTLGLIFQGVDCIDHKRGSGLRFPSVNASLLDPNSTPLINSLKLRNYAIQKIIRMLSLQFTKGSTRRISYAKLGIGQLGAVYETLISFTGIIAKEELIEIKPYSKMSKSYRNRTQSKNSSTKNQEIDSDNVCERHDNIDALEPCWFVERSRFDQFDPERVIFRKNEALIHPKGTFLYRLSGRDREDTASYYTPEPLARLLVKHALEELCRGLKADELLKLKILEPAMGSAAFLVETTNQLADLYLERKQRETGKVIPLDTVTLEKRRVRSLISDRNCFGVDLNPVAVELGAISLWLNSLHSDSFSTWLDGQLHSGNSAMGARRASYSDDQVFQKTRAQSWLNQPPTEVGWKEKLKDGHIWQWLLPAREMMDLKFDKSIVEISGDASRIIKDWRKGSFFGKFKEHEVALMQRLSDIAENLFFTVANELEKYRQDTNDEIVIWPNIVVEGNRDMPFAEKERIRNRLTGVEYVENTMPYKRLKTAMDAWCALWCWPLDKVEYLPSRDEFLNGMALILEGGFDLDGSITAPSIEKYRGDNLFSSLELRTPASDKSTNSMNQPDTLIRETNVESLVKNFDWLSVTVDVASREKFTHFDLMFADVMRDRKGFDLVIGNPPWINLNWNERKGLSSVDPVFDNDTELEVASSLGASPDVKRDGEYISSSEAFVRDFVSAQGQMNMTSSKVMNPYAGSGSSNLYRRFIDLSFRLVSDTGNVALVHQDGHLADPSCGSFRRHWYTRVTRHFEFRNEIRAKMFSEVHNNLEFSVNIYRGYSADICFDSFSNAFLASQIDDSYAHNGSGKVEGIKGDDGKWNTKGHRMRLIPINHDTLSIICSLSESDLVPVEETRFIRLHSTKMLDAVKLLAESTNLNGVVSETKVGSENSENYHTGEFESWQAELYWNEKDAQEKGIIQKGTNFYDCDKIILQGPQIYVANPLYKTARRISTTNRDYDVIDLVNVPDDYVPRTNYFPSNTESVYYDKLPICKWNNEKYHSDFFRLAFRSMVALSNERSLICCLIPSCVTHLSTICSIAFSNERDTLVGASLFSSLLADYYVKISGRKAFSASDAARFPWIDAGPTAHSRLLRLSCISSAYEDFWNRHAPRLNPMPWSSDDRRLHIEGPASGPQAWSRKAGLRTEFARRMALVEIDVLVAQAFGLNIEHLIDIYCLHFPTLKQNEEGTWYDQNGRIVWTCSMGIKGVGWLDEDDRSPSRAAWEKIVKNPPSELCCTFLDDSTRDGPHEVERCFVGPFTRCDRVADYRRAWTHFEQLKAQGGM